MWDRRGSWGGIDQGTSTPSNGTKSNVTKGGFRVVKQSSIESRLSIDLLSRPHELFFFIVIQFII